MSNSIDLSFATSDYVMHLCNDTTTNVLNVQNGNKYTCPYTFTRKISNYNNAGVVFHTKKKKTFKHFSFFQMYRYS